MKQCCVNPPAWAIVLAGGEGTRLRGLTRTIEGEARPKQFSRIYGERSLLGHTRERLRPIFVDDRLMFVVTKGHERFYRQELGDVEASRVLEQPANRGTGTAIIAALVQLHESSPDAIVGIFPSDHYYADDSAFAATVKSAIDVSHEGGEFIVLVGAKPEWPEVEFGWIEPGPPISNRCGATIFGVRRFCEKPQLPKARTLMRKGGLWNTFVAVGSVGAFLNVLAATQMDAMTRIRQAVMNRDLGSVYGEIEAIDFSRDVLSREPARLVVVEDAASGWADLGHPERVISTLDRHQIQPKWLSEMRATNPQFERTYACAIA